MVHIAATDVQITQAAARGMFQMSPLTREVGASNVDMTDADRRRAAGQGIKALAKALNARQVPSPQPADGQAPSGWAERGPVCAVCAVLISAKFRTGVTKKRDTWGQRRTQKCLATIGDQITDVSSATPASRGWRSQQTPSRSAAWRPEIERRDSDETAIGKRR